MYFGDAATVFTAPLHFGEKEWIETGAILGGTALLFAADEHVRTIAQRNQGTFGDNFFQIGTRYGTPWYGAGLSGVLYAGGLATSNRKLETAGIALFESLTFAGAVTTVLKTVAGRSRPYTNDGAFKYNLFQTKDEHLSFPSGHATVAFAVSSVLAEELHNTYASIGLYSLGAITMASRIYYDEHWISDTFLGAAIGTTIGITVAHLHDGESGESKVSVAPTTSGVAVVWRF
ncbi:MAG TPA: phosphatase PAP2 family protein [Bacteroidota bacterium]|nr:phosphatase PAP2 family protein [Bacteroidota bacterium]